MFIDVSHVHINTCMCTFTHTFKFTPPKLFYVAYNKGFILNKIKNMIVKAMRRMNILTMSSTWDCSSKCESKKGKTLSCRHFLMPFYSGNQQLFLYLQFYIIKIKVPESYDFPYF